MALPSCRHHYRDYRLNAAIKKEGLRARTLPGSAQSTGAIGWGPSGRCAPGSRVGIGGKDSDVEKHQIRCESYNPAAQKGEFPPPPAPPPSGVHRSAQEEAQSCPLGIIELPDEAVELFLDVPHSHPGDQVVRQVCRSA